MVEDGVGAAAFFAQVSRDLMNQPEEPVTFERVARRVVDLVPACEHAGILLRQRRGRVSSVAATSDLAEKCDLLQMELGEGPCLEAIWNADSYVVDDTGADPRWPRWGPRVAGLGVGSVLSIRLATDTETLGALNLYAGQLHAFGHEDSDLAMVFSAHAASAMAAARLVSGLQTAVQSRHLIGVAQGILMHRYALDLEQSFEVLRRYSSHANVKIRNLAALVVENGGLPDGGAEVIPPPQKD